VQRAFLVGANTRAFGIATIMRTFYMVIPLTVLTMLGKIDITFPYLFFAYLTIIKNKYREREKKEN
jgi:hypothetical protein